MNKLGLIFVISISSIITKLNYLQFRWFEFKVDDRTGSDENVAQSRIDWSTSADHYEHKIRFHSRQTLYYTIEYFNAAVFPIYVLNTYLLLTSSTRSVRIVRYA